MVNQDYLNVIHFADYLNIIYQIESITMSRTIFFSISKIEHKLIILFVKESMNHSCWNWQYAKATSHADEVVKNLYEKS